MSEGYGYQFAWHLLQVLVVLKRGSNLLPSALCHHFVNLFLHVTIVIVKGGASIMHLLLSFLALPRFKIMADACRHRAGPSRSCRRSGAPVTKLLACCFRRGLFTQRNDNILTDIQMAMSNDLMASISRQGKRHCVKS